MEDFRKIQKGQWLFTCRLEPVQFGQWDARNPKYWDRSKFSDEEWKDFIEFDDFITLKGGHHSRANCSLTPISDEYAKWFNDNKMWEHYKQVEGDDTDAYDDYVKIIQAKAAEDGIECEGW